MVQYFFCGETGKSGLEILARAVRLEVGTARAHTGVARTPAEAARAANRVVNMAVDEYRKVASRAVVCRTHLRKHTSLYSVEE